MKTSRIFDIVKIFAKQGLLEFYTAFSQLKLKRTNVLKKWLL